MSAPAFTRGPWRVEEGTTLVWGACDPADRSTYGMGYPVTQARVRLGAASEYASEFREDEAEANAHLIAAAPELYDGCNAMLGLVQLILGRDDLSPELREVLTTNHRIAEAEAATAKARGESPSTHQPEVRNDRA